MSTSNVHIANERVIPSPRELKAALTLPPSVENLARVSRDVIKDILQGKDKRLIVVVGPCSIHSFEEAIEYARRLKSLESELNHSLFIVMRTYFEKPRTSIGWKGFINDPRLDDSFDVESGIRLARQLLIEIGTIGLPVGTEALDPVVPQYLDDLMSWTAIGARTTESQTHREMASGLSTPVGFKNATDGNIQVAIHALKSAALSHHFLGINQDGKCAVLKTKGNPYTHVVLRGGGGQPNFDSVHVAQSERLLLDADTPPRLMIDCSHGNSMKDHRLQKVVLEDCAHQITNGNQSIIGLMLESNLEEGNQKMLNDGSALKRGVSITDACMGWEQTEDALRRLSSTLATSLKMRSLL
jgi:3-deoxy-7-phosphoheptulonate synthase